METQRAAACRTSALSGVAPGALVIMAGIRLGSATECLLVATQEEQVSCKMSLLLGRRNVTKRKVTLMTH